MDRHSWRMLAHVVVLIISILGFAAAIVADSVVLLGCALLIATLNAIIANQRGQK